MVDEELSFCETCQWLVENASCSIATLLNAHKPQHHQTQGFEAKQHLKHPFSKLKTDVQFAQSSCLKISLLISQDEDVIRSSRWPVFSSLFRATLTIDAGHPQST